MKRLCIIGTSHIAALKLGWERIKENCPEIGITFFGAPGKHCEQLRLVDNALVLATDEDARVFKRFCGTSRVMVDYDAFLLVDLGIGTHSAVLFSQKVRTEEQSRDDRRPISDACFASALRGLLGNAFALDLARTLRKVTRVPIGLVPAPMRSSDYPSPRVKALVNSGGDRTVARACAQAMREVAAQAGLRLYPQPDHTLDGPLYTSPVYSRARERDTESEDIRNKDRNHMNAQYGEIVLRVVLPDIFSEARVAA